MLFQSKLYISLAVCLLAVVFQNNAQNYEVINLEALLNSGTAVQKSSLQKSRMTKSSEPAGQMDIEQIRSLVYDLKPTVYVEDQKLKQFEDQAPEIAEVKNNSINLIKTGNTLFNQVELLKLKLDTQSAGLHLDIKELPAFKNLKYIYVECSYNCSISEIERMFSNTGNLKILYLITQSE